MTVQAINGASREDLLRLSEHGSADMAKVSAKPLGFGSNYFHPHREEPSKKLAL